MKKFASKKAAMICLILTVILMIGYGYLMARPISYGMEYHNVSVYDGFEFEGTMRFLPDGTMYLKNSNFFEEVKSFYYYKKGYLFYTLATTEEEYKAEVAMINENFEEAVNTPFYADEINAFHLISSDEGISLDYKCQSAIKIAVIGAIVEIVMIGITCVFFVASKKKNR